MGRPLSGVSAPKNRRLSVIDRVSMANTGAPYQAPEPTALPRQLSTVESAPEKNNEVKPAAKAVAKPKAAKAEKPDKKVLVSEADEIAAHKKKMEAERIERDIRAYAIRKAHKDAAAKRAAKNK